MYKGCPGDSDAAMSLRKLVLPSEELNQELNVAGNRIMLEANIGGITPDILSFRGR
jgi:hypothetical protein